jgi:hypothetical protein
VWFRFSRHCGHAGVACGGFAAGTTTLCLPCFGCPSPCGRHVCATKRQP